MSPLRYHFTMFGEPDPPLRDTVESGIYHPFPDTHRVLNATLGMSCSYIALARTPNMLRLRRASALPMQLMLGLCDSTSYRLTHQLVWTKYAAAFKRMTDDA